MGLSFIVERNNCFGITLIFKREYAIMARYRVYSHQSMLLSLPNMKLLRYQGSTSRKVH